VSIELNACLACWANFPAIKNEWFYERVCVKFSFQLRKTISDTSEIVKQAFGDEAVSRTLMSGITFLMRADVQ